ncbi:hypothetical protein Y1Q_0023394 [Alligator mississippiensis]|uniref:Reverse transcriptase domain-containing protein n=1 Tax=Alligator mississippiensis TaxID=8496 RepID=A0A151NPP6_ALLMI|nr:hypothetical protein Y1Q_0023394 [Alligator mississippiensis]
MFPHPWNSCLKSQKNAGLYGHGSCSCSGCAPGAFIDLQKAFTMVSKNGIYKTGYPQKVLSLFKDFHEGMKETIQYENETSSEFSIDPGMKQGCVLALISFGIFFSILLKYTSGNDQSGVLVTGHWDAPTPLGGQAA